ncbi:MAG: hypothetical protein U5M23_08465 [Marinagarivorans sp.]|nr:hypothetical protein [Marinagarivorans sp.]
MLPPVAKAVVEAIRFVAKADCNGADCQRLKSYSCAEAAIGDLAGDLSGRRGHIMGTDARGHGLSAITGEVPLAELNDYQSRLKSLTGGRVVTSIEFARYSAVPPMAIAAAVGE